MLPRPKRSAPDCAASMRVQSGAWISCRCGSSCAMHPVPCRGAWWARSTWAGCRLMRSGLQNQYVAWERGLRYSGRRKSERLNWAQVLPIWILSIGRRLASMKGMATPNSAGWKISRQARRDCSCRRSSWRFIRMTKWAWSADDPPSCASVSL